MAWCVVENMPPVKHGTAPSGERDTVREMAHLVRPDARYHASYLAAHDELVRESADGQAARDGDGDWQQAPDPTTGFAGLSFTRESLEDPAEFRRLVAARRAEELPETPRPAGRVPCTFLWLVEGEEYLGSFALRHELTPWLLDQGGHIGYRVRPSARERGHGRTGLEQTLELAAEMGMPRVLITCREDNLASRRVIEHVGGVLEDVRGGMRRCWVELGPSPSPDGVRPRP